MPLTFEAFHRLSESSWFGSRDIVVSEKLGKAKLGNLFFSSGSKTNDATMEAFRSALSKKCGVFGEHAFDTVLGSRHQLHKSLRVCDVEAVISKLEMIKVNRFIGEVNRQLDTDPKLLELSDELQIKTRAILAKSPLGGCCLKDCYSPEVLTRMAAERIAAAIEEAMDEAAADNARGGRQIDMSAHELGSRSTAEKTVKNDEPTGLSNLKTTFGTYSNTATSVEDRVKKGLIGVGMTINRSSTNPMLLDKIKTNGVEPGFICRRDWSKDDTRSMMADIDSPESHKALDDLKRDHPGLAAKCEGLGLRDQILLFGRAHPACMAAAAELLLEEGMKDQDSAIYKAFSEKFHLTRPEDWESLPLDSVKKELFTEIRDAAMAVKPGDPAYAKSPIFKQFTDRHIIKLDYNEGDRIFAKKAGSAGSFMRPERVKMGRSPVYRLKTAKTADDISAGAVTEALANDLTRIAGVPSQELSIVRGQYSDGHPKLMLEAKFADGYKDMERGYLKDGQIVPPQGETVEGLGKYKAFFLVTADRDAVGTRGQNKGFIKGKDGQPSTFFAIDPGHTLEGNSRDLAVEDNFSYKDTHGYSDKPRFRNFSVFDDDTRFAKFQGALGMRALKDSGKAKELFDAYREAFDPEAEGISPEEKSLRVKIHAEIKKKEDEFNDSLAKVLNIADNQFHLYDDLAAEGPAVQEKAIEAIENLEKLTSPTTWVSPKGQTPLKHLAVIPETRVPWRGHVDGDNIIYHCDQPLSEAAKEQLTAYCRAAGIQCHIDAEGCASVAISKYGAEQKLDALSERNVASVTHLEESAARAAGRTGLEEAKNYVSPLSAAPAGVPAHAPFPLPDTLEVRVGRDRFTFQKLHYEAMVANAPAAERPKNVDELRAMLAARIQRGRTILMAVFSGNGHRYAATPRNAACVTLAMHAATVAKGELNTRGAFSVADPDGYLYKWLDSSKEVYMRTATHAHVFHHQKVDGHMNMPRGFDIPEGMGGLMGGMRTFHYFALPSENEGRRRLYLKCETYGIYRSTISPAEEESSRAPGMQTRKSRWGDTAESVKHCLSLATVFSRMGASEGNRKENFPAAVKTSMEAAQRELRNAGHGDLADKLGRNVGKAAGKSQGGIRQLLGNLADILDAAPGNETVLKAASVIIDAAAEYAGERSGEGSYRMGNEVMLEREEVV